MKNTAFLPVIVILTMTLLITSCAAGASQDGQPFPAMEASDADALPQTGWTKSVPSGYDASAQYPGTVVTISYDTRDYARGGTPIQKTADVYLPYGYDESDAATRYDIIYLMHGWTGYAGEYFSVGNGMIKNMLDRMIQNGEVASVIAVSPSFYADVSDNGFSSSVMELQQFHQDFLNDLMSAVEGRFHTYAASTSQADLSASRDHRAFGGFSLGGVTTWMQFCYNADYIRYYLPMSGSCWHYGGYGDDRPVENCDFLETLIAKNA